MPTYAVQLAYDGTRYNGWQTQKNGICVQEKVQEALNRLENAAHTVYGAGRTDRGAHAWGQVAHFNMIREWEAPRLLLALDAQLPDDISVMRVKRVPELFHARYDAKSREYLYIIWNGAVCYPHIKPYVYWLPGEFNWEPAQQASQCFLGEHDFRLFTRKEPVSENTVRTVLRVRLSRRGACLLFRVRANGFLTYMVRNMAGALVEIARGARSVDWLTHLMNITNKRVPPVGKRLPSQGLHLWKVCYDPPLWSPYGK